MVNFYFNYYIFRRRRFWTKKETLAFLNAYRDRLVNLHFGRGHECRDTEFKIKNFAGAQKLDSEKIAGESPSNFPFLKEMDDIFGDSLILSNVEVVNLSGKPVKPLTPELSMVDCQQGAVK